MSDWSDTVLGSVITFQRGFDLTEKAAVPGPFPVISSSGYSYSHSKAKVRGPGVMTGRKGVLGKVHYSETDFWPHDTTLWVKDFQGSHPRFVYYWLQTLPLSELDAGTSNPTLNRNHAHLLKVTVPAVHLQKAIADVLDSIDDLIENNRKRIGVLEEMAQAIYREWFVHFRFAGHEDATFVDSPLGPIPKGWEVRPLAELATVVRGRSYRKHELVDDGGLPFVNLKCMMRGGGFRIDGLKRYAGDYKAPQLVSHGDIVLAVTDLTQGREILAQATLVPRLVEEHGVISLDVGRIVPDDNEERLPLFFALRCTDFADRVKEYANGSTVLHLSPKFVEENQLVWPEQSLRQRYRALAEPMIVILDDLRETAERLASIRDLLLPKLVSGEIDVSGLDLDALVGAVS